MKLTFVIYALGAGGAERVMSLLANHFAARGDEVTLITLDDGQTPPFFPLDPRVTWQPAGTAAVSGSPIARVGGLARRAMDLRRRLRAAEPDAVVSFMDRTNFLTLVATLGMKTPVIVSERNDPSQHAATHAARLARSLLYRRARAIVVQTQNAAAYFGPPLQAKTLVIPNPVPAPPAGEPAAKTGTDLIAMGRFAPEKGFDLLLDAFAQIAPRFPDWTLTIWGDGELRPALETQRDALGLADRVRFPGKTKTPAEVMRRADLFVLSSRYEGFPNVLAEAMACGLPAVSFACPSGPGELIRDGENGILVSPQNVQALAGALARLMANESERLRLGVNAARVTETFSPERIMAQWERAIASHTGAAKEQDETCAASPAF